MNSMGTVPKQSFAQITTVKAATNKANSSIHNRRQQQQQQQQQEWLHK
jgi:hypothetical protein